MRLLCGGFTVWPEKPSLETTTVWRSAKIEEHLKSTYIPRSFFARFAPDLSQPFRPRFSPFNPQKGPFNATRFVPCGKPGKMKLSRYSRLACQNRHL